MKAMVFAAGLGTRLRPYTNDRPKALVEVGGRTLLEIVFHRLKLAGIEEVIVNVHHYADLVINTLEQNKGFGLKVVVSDEREQLLETGGGLKKAQKWLQDEPFLVHNVDVLTNLDLREFIDFHHENKVLATLAVRSRTTSRYLHFDPENYLCGWENTKTKELKITRMADAFTALAFSGVSIFDPAIFHFMPKDEAAFSTIPVLLEAAKSHKILAYPHDETIWLDVGKPETLALAEGLLPQLMPVE